MKLTSQQEFGLRCLLRLAREETVASAVGDDGPKTLPVNKISEDEGLSNEYAGKLMLVLSRSGLVDSVRGRNGGYRLSRPAAEISLAETLDALGGKLYDHETCDRFSGDRHLCIHTDACNIRSVWTGLQYLIDQVLTRTSLQDLVDYSEEGMTEWVHRHIQALVASETGSGAGETPIASPGRRGPTTLDISPARGYRGRPVGRASEAVGAAADPPGDTGGPSPGPGRGSAPVEGRSPAGSQTSRPAPEAPASGEHGSEKHTSEVASKK